VLALIGVCGLVVAAAGVRGQLKPRTFTPAQQKRIQAWEVAKRWRTMPKTQIFPAVIGYHLGSTATGPKGRLALRARRLEIARQASCVRAAGGSHRFMALLDREGCTAVLRSTYADATSSLVLTAGVAVMKDAVQAAAAARFLTGGDRHRGGLSHQLVLRPLRVNGTPAALYGFPQRQLSWVVAAGPYLVMATVAYADGRPRASVTSDSYAFREMTSLARGVAAQIAAPLGAVPPFPRCPGAQSCCPLAHGRPPVAQRPALATPARQRTVHGGFPVASRPRRRWQP
jgi:hypothetical protein